jgi:hypothetical protein
MEIMSVYRIKHKATGLYYCRSRDVRIDYTDSTGRKQWRYTKSNLSSKGKLYPAIPSSAWYTGNIYNHIEHQNALNKESAKIPVGSWYTGRKLNPTIQRTTVDDWEIEEVGKPTAAAIPEPKRVVPGRTGRVVTKAKSQSVARQARAYALRTYIDQSPGYFDLFSGYNAGYQAAIRRERKETKKPVSAVAVITPGTEKPLRNGAFVRSLRSRSEYVFLGEIPNMPEHGIFADISGKVHFGLHLSDFREQTEEEV